MYNASQLEISIMAEISSGESRKKQTVGVRKSKKLSTRIDLTPMVDLGFLLITFFIFTTALSEPKVMKLIMPKDTGTMTPTTESGALTILPTVNGTVYYYEGNFEEAKFKSATLKNLREVIIHKKKITPAQKLYVIIKPSKASDYGDVVNVLDEMLINDISRYALVDITEREEALMQ